MWRGCMAASAGGARQDILGPPGILQTFVFILFDDSYTNVYTFFILFGLGRPRQGSEPKNFSLYNFMQ